MRRSRITLLFMLLLTLLVSSFAAVHAQDDSKVLHIVLNPDLRTSDPHIAYETETWPSARCLCRSREAG